MEPPKEIKENKLLLVEGADAYYFCIWAYQAFGAAGIQVLDFGGIADLSLYLRLLSHLPNFEKVSTLVIARDAEDNPTGAIKSIKSTLRKIGLPAPAEPFSFKGDKPRLAYMIFPGLVKNKGGKTSCKPGTLEDLCLAIVRQDVVMECVEEYTRCLKGKGLLIRHLHKLKLHAYLSGKNEFAGLKIGEAAKAGAWDWGHEKLEPFRKIIQNM
ncbi:MAG: DUF3226 domain-containing protein [Thermodesulfobacteriota bacterium]